MNNLRHAVRALARRPGYSLASILVLALGMGATATAFSLVNSGVLRPLPFASSGRVVEIWRNGPRGDRHVTPSQKELNAIVNRCSDLATVVTYGSVTAKVQLDKQPVYLHGAEVSPGWFSLFGTRVALGRPFAVADTGSGETSEVILSRGVWSEYFHQDASLIGRTVTFDSKPYVVIGVAGEDTAAPYFPADFWFPVAATGRAAVASTAWSVVLGKLRDGVPLQGAQVQLDAIESSLAQAGPDFEGRTIEAALLKDVLEADARPMLLALLAASGLLLLIACANVAFLGFIRNDQRRQEIEMRQALGGSKLRILRMLLAENFLIVSSASAAGLVFTFWATHLMASRAAAFLPRATRLRVDGFVVAAVVAMWLLAILATGLVPAKISLTFRRQGRPWISRPASGQKFLSGFVASEVTLSVILLVGFALLSTSLVRLLTVDLGFNPQNLLTFWASSPGSTGKAYGAFFRNAEAHIAGIPGVAAVGAASNGFFSGSTQTHYYMQGPPPDPDDMPLTEVRYVSSGFLRAVGVALTRGRFWDERGIGVGPQVVVNESFERSSASRIPFSRQRIFIRGRLRQVVGVVADIRDLSSPGQARSTVYVPFFDSPQDVGMIVVRTDVPPSNGMIAAVRRKIVAAGGEQPIFGISTAKAIFSRILNPAEFRTSLLGVFASLGYFISLIGVYGVAAYAVSRSQQEVGIRMALGATPGRLFTAYLITGVRSALAGLLLGVVASLALMRFVSGLLFATAPRDPVVVGAVASLIGVSACIACLVPAMRAVRVDPAALLRLE